MSKIETKMIEKFQKLIKKTITEIKGKKMAKNCANVENIEKKRFQKL